MKLSLTSVTAIGCGLVALLATLYAEGGQLAQVVQPSAALVVLGGTASAVALQFSPRMLRLAWRQTWAAFARDEGAGDAPGKEQILRLALKAKRAGLVSLDAELKTVGDVFLRRSLMLAVDGVHSAEIAATMQPELDRLAEEEDSGAQVWEAAGGFAPTFGILGAVLGLIDVLRKLDDLGMVGRGIAVAFVATLYGVGSANLLFLPLAGKLRLRARSRYAARLAVLDAVCAIADGVSLRLLRERLGLPIPTGNPETGKLRRMASR